MTEAYPSELIQQAEDAYNSSDFSLCQSVCTQALKEASDTTKSVIKLLRACAFYKLGKYSRALSDCSEVLGYSDARVLSPANQLKGECFLREEDSDAAEEAFQAAQERGKELIAGALDAFIAASRESGSGVDFDSLQNFSVTSSVGLFLHLLKKTKEGKAFDVRAASKRSNQAMARPGPSVRAEDLSVSDAPYAGNVELLAPSKYRMQFNQNSGMVEVQVFAKQLNKRKERVTVDIQENSLKVQILSDDLSTVEYELDEKLYQPVDVEQSKWDVLGTQVNIKLKKQDGVIVWPSLSYSDEPAVPGGASIVDPTAGPATAYPSSNMKTVRDWNKLEQDVKAEEKDEKLDGDAGLNKFFGQLYAGADEDTRRAMNKSFQESGGTSLSTNWKDVGSKSFECKPPDGVKVKKFEQ